MGLGAENPGFRKLESLFSKGVLKNKAGKIVEEALQAGVDPKLLAAVIAHESARVTSNIAKTKNNPGGIMDWDNAYKTARSFPSMDAGIAFTARNLKKQLDRAGGSVEVLKKIYAPDKAENDPTGLNQYWLSGVSKFYNELAATEMPEAIPASGSTLLAR